MIRWVVKVGSSVLNVIHPCKLSSGKDISSPEDLKARALYPLITQIQSYLFGDQRISAEEQEVW